MVRMVKVLLGAVLALLPLAVAAISQHGPQVVVEPGDPYYELQWNLHNTGQGGGAPDADIDAPEAWNITTGRSDVVIAVVGDGVYLEHEDLQSKLWVNPGEIPDNGLDDDGNGYVDDVHGYDFAEGKPEPSPVSWTGTFVAGIAAAATDNGVGIAGVSWGARIMSVKVLRRYSDGSIGGTIEDIVEGMTYAVNNGTHIIIAAFSTPATCEAICIPEDILMLQGAVDYAYNHGVLVVAGAGDWGQASPVVYPSVFPYVMAVSGTDRTDRRVQTSSCGHWVDVAAPVASIISACVSPAQPSLYCYFSYGQTVLAAAHVAGLAALVWSVNPDLTVDEVRAIIEGSADKVDAIRYPYDPDGRNDCYGHGRINAEKALLATPHALHLYPSSLTFLADEATDAPLCYTITNPNTGALTWRASSDADWLSLDGPTGQTPSHVTACADQRALPGYGTYHATITPTSTLTMSVGGPMTIPVTFVYTDTVRRFYWPIIVKRARAP